MQKFIPGIDLCEAFYHEAVRPILDRKFPDLVHSAARLDQGSDVLGFDTPQSMDHQWGPRTMLFLSDADCERFAKQITEVLAYELPYEILGFPTHFESPDDSDGCLKLIDKGPICHGVNITTIRGFFGEYLSVDPLAGISEVEWMLLPQQLLRTVSSRKIFHDGLGELAAACRALEWYPRDVWLYLLACQWRRIDQEEPFMARCGDVGDELGSRVVAARLTNEIMRLCFLMERKYWPYYKWFGTAFSRLECAELLTPIFHAVFDSREWKTREEHLSAAYLHVARMHNELGITEFVEPEISSFHDRPYQVPHSDRFVQALRARIESETVRNLPEHMGAVSQFADSTDLLDWLPRMKKLRAIYE